MRRTVVLIILGFLLTACGLFALKHKMEAVMSSKIVLPDNMLKVYQGNTYPAEEAQWGLYSNNYVWLQQD